MKNIIYSFRSIMITVLLPLLLTISACTKNFETYNTNPNGITDEQLKVDFNNIGAFYPSIQKAFTVNNMIPMDVGEFLTGGTFGGYFMVTLPGANYTNYSLIAGWAGYGMFDVGYNSIMSPVNEIKRRGTETLAPDYWAIALILKVAGMQRVTDIYGPVPYSKFGQGGTSVPYDSQEAIYDAFFSELDIAVDALKGYIVKYPGARPFRQFDNTYSGNYTKWLKYANSVRLRLAMQIVKINPGKAKLQAVKAVDVANGGVLSSNADNAFVSEVGNALHVAANIWGDVRTNAAIISYMVGYNDPRIGKYFEPSSVLPGQYVGLRVGSNIVTRANSIKYSNVSAINFTQTTPVQLMNASEVFFLRAEGALRGWDMGGSSVQKFYEDGITNSFTQWGVAGAASAYINDATSKPADYADPLNAVNSSAALSAITIKWDEAATKEQKLERIITQKWISNFPDGTTAWSTFRRTGYPKLFPVVLNNSGGTIDTKIQIRRMNYPGSEYVTNAAEVAKGVTLLGGLDNGGTRLWWDVNKDNF